MKAEKSERLELALKTGVIPDRVFEMPWLTELTITGGTLKSLSPRLAELKNLVTLNLDKQPKLDLSSLPVMPKLQHLGLRSCKLKSLPDSLFALRSLRILSLGNNPLGSVPESIGQLKNLEVLYLWGCRLSQVPRALGTLKKLRILELEKNALSELPDSLAGLANLEELLLEKNAFTTFPKVVCRLGKLRRLELYDNSIGALPDEMTQLKALGSLRMEGNPLARFPADLSPLEALETWYVSLAISKEQLHEQVRALPPKAFVMSFECGDLARDGRWSDLPARASAELVPGAAVKENQVFRHQGRVCSVAFLDGAVAAAGYDKLRIWDLATGRERCSVPGEAFHVSAPPDGSVLLASSFSEVRLHDPATGKLLDRLAIPHLDRATWSADGKVLLLQTKTSAIVLDARTHKKLAQLDVPGGMTFGALSHDGKLVLHGVKKAVRVWDRTTGKEVLRATVDRFLTRAGEFSADNSQVYAIGYEPAIVKVAMGQKKPQPVSIATPEKNECFALAGTRAVVAGPEVRLIDLATGKATTLGSHEAVGPVDQVAVSPDGALAASCGCDCTVRLWSLA